MPATEQLEQLLSSRDLVLVDVKSDPEGWPPAIQERINRLVTERTRRSGNDRIRRGLEAAKRALADLEEALDAEIGESDIDRYRRILTAVEEEGGRVSAERWYEIGRETGYSDNRALGGFFRADGGAMRIDGDERVLTDKGREYLDQYGRLG